MRSRKAKDRQFNGSNCPTESFDFFLWRQSKHTCMCIVFMYAIHHYYSCREYICDTLDVKQQMINQFIGDCIRYCNVRLNVHLTSSPNMNNQVFQMGELVLEMLLSCWVFLRKNPKTISVYLIIHFLSCPF